MIDRSPQISKRTGAHLLDLVQLAGTLCADPQFQAWIGASGQDVAAEYIRATCDVQSRSELATNPEAARKFHERIRRPYLAHLAALGASTC